MIKIAGLGAAALSMWLAAQMSTASGEIAFSSRRDGNWEIYVMDAAGGHQRRLTRRDAEDRFALWSPDARQIAFGSSTGTDWELWVMDADGANQRRRRRAIGTQYASHDGAGRRSRSLVVSGRRAGRVFVGA